MLVAPREPRFAGTSPEHLLMERPRLARALGPTDRTLIGLVVAPSGFGKTILLRQWLREDPRAGHLLVLRPQHVRPISLLNAIVQLLGSTQERAPVLLALDRAELLSPTSAELLLTVAEQLPAGSLLAVASTCEPPLPIGRLRLEGRLREVRAADLAMTPTEVHQYLRRSHLTLEDDELATLMRRTEGWPAGVSLAVRALGEAHDRSAALEGFGGDDYIVADYLRDVFLDRLGADDLDLVLRTSVLDELTPSLCDAIAGREGSGRSLRALARSNLLLDALDRPERTFRLHPLLRDLLRSELRRAGAQRERCSHVRAARWFERTGDHEQAAAHAAAAGDAGEAGRLLWISAPTLLVEGRGACLEAGLGRFTPSQLAREPALALATAVCGLGRGDGDHVEHWTDVGERALAATGAGDRARFAAGIAVLRAAVARGGLTQMGADARRAHGLAGEHVAWRSLACLFDGVARHLAGDLELARERLAEGARIGSLGGPLAEMLCHAQLALMNLLEDAWRDGARHADLAREAMEAHGLADAPMSAVTHGVTALAGAYDGHVEQARRDVAAARRLLRSLRHAPPWLGAEIQVALARAELRMSDSVAARDLLVGAGRLARRCPDAIVMRAAIDDGWQRVDRFAAEAVAGVSALTTAELRVLRMLPSHMSLGEIAGRLHVSTNTVKTQAHAVYRKLDVSSRSDAVTRARNVGLIDP